MRVHHWIVVAGCFLAAASACPIVVASSEESGVIRLGPASPRETPTDESELLGPSYESRRGFDYQAFGARLEGYWFQRKLQFREGRDGDAVRQAANIAAFVKEEGIRRLESPGGALLSEASRHVREGNYDRAREALALAEIVDSGRPQTRFLRARVAWNSNSGPNEVATELWAGLRATVAQVVAQPEATQPVVLKLLVALMIMSILFPLLMVVRHQAALRHEVEEWLVHGGRGDLAAAGGWAFLLAPFVLWVGAGWIALWWTLITFRFMRRAERVVALALLLATALAVPGYRFAVGLYGLATDPKVRTSVSAAAGAYEPDRIVKLQELVATDPDDPTYRFLLAGLYKNGRYFEEAFDQYRAVLKLAPETWQARVNIGNIYFQTGQYSEAIAQYRQAIELRPDDVLAHCNMYLAQTESFKLNEAKVTLDKARGIDASAVARVLAAGGDRRDRSTVRDATIDLGAIWSAAIEGRKLEDWLGGEEGGGTGWSALLRGLLNPMSVIAFLTMIGCGVLLAAFRTRRPAGRCQRCGRAFCSDCRIARDDHEYCSQCMHLFVLRDGLAPETKTRKLYEIESYERRGRLARRVASVLVPGTGLVLRERTVWGTLLLLVWVVSLVVCWPEAAWPVERLLGFDVRLDLLRAGPVPDMFDLDPALLLAVPLAAAAWIAGNLILRVPREA